MHNSYRPVALPLRHNKIEEAGSGGTIMSSHVLRPNQGPPCINSCNVGLYESDRAANYRQSGKGPNTFEPGLMDFFNSCASMTAVAHNIGEVSVFVEDTGKDLYIVPVPSLGKSGQYTLDSGMPGMDHCFVRSWSGQHRNDFDKEYT